MKILFNGIILLFVFLQTSAAGPFLDKTKEIAGSAVDIVSETSSDVSKAVQGKKESPAVARSKINTMAKKSLDNLFIKYPNTKKIFENASGYAVFDSR